MKITDERILSEKRRINSKILSYAYIALWLILLYRQFILKQAFTEYLDIFALTIGVALALAISNVWKGLYLTDRSSSQRRTGTIIGTLVAGTVAFAINYFMNGENFSDSLLYTGIFVSFFAVTQYALQKISIRKAEEDVSE